MFAQTVAAGYTNSFSDKQFQAAKYYFNCGEIPHTRGADDTYWAFSLGPKLDEAGRHAYCSKSLDDYNIASTEYNSAKIAFNEALDTIDQCIDASDRGWDIELERVTLDGVILKISTFDLLGGDLLGIDVIPPGALTCNPAPPIGPVHLTTTKSISITCSRPRTTQVIEGVSVAFASEAGLSLRLVNTREGDRHFPIKLAAYSVPGIDATIKKIDALQAQVDAIRKEMEVRFSQSSSASAATGK